MQEEGFGPNKLRQPGWRDNIPKQRFCGEHLSGQLYPACFGDEQSCLSGIACHVALLHKCPITYCFPGLADASKLFKFVERKAEEKSRASGRLVSPLAVARELEAERLAAEKPVGVPTYVRRLPGSGKGKKRKQLGSTSATDDGNDSDSGAAAAEDS